jgi:tellurite resistance-related uncharacterized protein
LGKLAEKEPPGVIVTRLIGGLGNQMFQYAAGRAVARRLSVPLKIDSSGFANYHLHRYSLHNFTLEAAEASPQERPSGDATSPQGLIRRRLGPGAPPGLRVYREQAFTFDPNVLTLGDGTYLDGYWQSERYFADSEPLIRRDFTLRTPPTAENAEWLGRIASTPAVSLHVRRGDYASDPRTNAFHGLCSPEYYARAARFITDRTEGQPEFYVFSDDPTWVRENFRLDFLTHYITHNTKERDYEDLRLMSACRHHILANSTFSWWGAWLSPSPKKIVVAPQHWFRDATVDDRDLIPAAWVRL